MKFALVFVALLSFQAVSAGLDVNSMARKYLNKYRYLAPSYERGGNHDFTSAIKQMQRFAHIPQTGVVDAATFRLMHTPRCGMPDKSQGKSNRARRYSTNIANRHSQNNLKYYVQHGADLSADLQDQIFATAFQHWAKVSSLTFSQTRILNDANLLIRVNPIFNRILSLRLINTTQKPYTRAPNRTKYYLKYYHAFKILPDTLDEIDERINEEQARAECNYQTDPNVIKEYESRDKEIKSMSGQIDAQESNLAAKQQQIANLKERWLVPLQELLAKINVKYGEFFRMMGCAGEVSLSTDQAVSAGLDVNSMARKYLNKYRYLAPSYERGGNHDFTSAIKQMQRFAHIPQTGVVDAATFRLMHTPRCGMPDKSQGKSNRARR
ncbi:predicted protein [Nematostella vectensis]|uniref:Peptidoglycan binding-like domain-containing protein n=1 Tax=Nematostella vectensis TaxID=45351 RepID=A7RJE8_NEMVE|nr:predicted protein [Nematostella vectensis]|eukprot:XP_001640428.1 predicted protein [Nematostella vectensis]